MDRFDKHRPVRVRPAIETRAYGTGILLNMYCSRIQFSELAAAHAQPVTSTPSPSARTMFKFIVLLALASDDALHTASRAAAPSVRNRAADGDNAADSNSNGNSAAGSGSPSSSCVTSCGDPSVPLPFTPECARAFSTYGPLSFPRATPATLMAATYELRRMSFDKVICKNRTAISLIAAAVQDGLVVGGLGLDLGAWGRALLKRRGNSALRTGSTQAWAAALSSLGNDEQFGAITDAYFGHWRWRDAFSFAGVGKVKGGYALPAALVPMRLLAADMPARYRGRLPPLGPAARALYNPLFLDGFVKVNRWDGIEINKISAVANWALDARQQTEQARGRGAVVTAQPAELGPLLAPLLASQPLRLAIDAYLGTGGKMSACSYGYTALRLNNWTTPSNYISSLWHHDRVGRRLKLFVFLHDVDAVEGRPTTVARGTHNFVWFTGTGLGDSRFDSAWIEHNYDIVALDGPRGGGFLLDTNSLHVGRWQGKHARSVVIVELDRQRRCREVVHGGSTPLSVPSSGRVHTVCPSRAYLPISGAGVMPTCDHFH